MHKTDISDRLPIFVSALPDETLHSIISRSFTLSCENSSSTYLNKLFGNRHAITAVGLPSKIGRLATCLQSNSIEIDTNYIINELTLFPYFSAFLPSETAESLRQKMLGIDGRSIKISIGLVAHGLGASEPLRQCHLCIADDFNKYGQPYWHRSHQLPGIEVCHIHKIPLIVIDCPATNKVRHQLFLPHQPALQCIQPIESTQLRKLNNLNHKLAIWSHLLLTSKLPQTSLTDMRKIYTQHLIELGLSYPSGRVRQKELSEFMMTYHHNFDYLNIYDGLSRCQNEELPWVARLVRKPRSAQHPLHHLLLSMAIFENWETFLESIQQFKPRKIIYPIIHQEDKYQTIQKLIGQKKCSLRETARHVGLSVTTVGIIARQLGLKVSARPKYIDSDKIQSCRDMLAKGVSIPTIAYDLRISAPSVRRILRSYPDTLECRKNLLLHHEFQKRVNALLANIKQLELNDRKSIRRYCYKHITWFRRHHPTWLSQFLSQYHATSQIPHTRVDWIQRDQDFVKLLINTRNSILATPGKPIRITKTELGRRAGRLDWLDKHLDKLPTCCEYLDNNVETRTGYKKRCIDWAVGQLHKQNISIVTWRIKRLAAIKKHDNAEITSYINSICSSRLLLDRST